MATSSAPSTPDTGHVRWRRVLLLTLIPVLGIMWAGGALGAGTVELAGAGLGVLALVGGWLVINPWLHKHRYPGGKPERKRTTGSLNYPGQRGKGLRQPFRPGGSMSRRHRPAMAPFRRRGGAGLRPGTGRHRGSTWGRRGRSGAGLVSPKRRGGSGLTGGKA